MRYRSVTFRATFSLINFKKMSVRDKVFYVIEGLLTYVCSNKEYSAAYRLGKSRYLAWLKNFMTTREKQSSCFDQRLKMSNGDDKSLLLRSIQCVNIWRSILFLGPDLAHFGPLLQEDDRLKIERHFENIKRSVGALREIPSLV